MEHPGRPMPKPHVKRGKYVPWICSSEHPNMTGFGTHIVWEWGDTPKNAYENWKTRFIQSYGHL